MNNFRKWIMWVASINPKFNRKLLDVPTADLTKLFSQPDSSKREGVFVIKGSNECIVIDAVPSK